MLYFMEVWQEDLSDLKSFRNIFIPIVQINQSAAQTGLSAHRQPIAELAALSTKVWIEQKSPKWTLHSLDGVTYYPTFNKTLMNL